MLLNLARCVLKECTQVILSLSHRNGEKVSRQKSIAIKTDNCSNEDVIQAAAMATIVSTQSKRKTRAFVNICMYSHAHNLTRLRLLLKLFNGTLSRHVS
jgi:hypothetical protein